ncbi:speckle-type POZ protein-like [Chrysoperla carnea]|uniref:speckle-type POZ protein-like n=1 Tax=Chrysoperla carnea TaxID=189513 RepID=UPI001D0687F8|nr:speckle-type POZ protein-like [Chrysoperla carnea]
MEQKSFTNIEVDKHIFLWTINNFSMGFKTIIGMGGTLTSPTFSTGKHNSFWHLKLNQKYNNNDYNIYLTLFLKFVSSDKKEARVKYKFAIINEKGEEAHKFEDVHRFYLEKEISYDIIKKDLVLNKEYKLLSDDKLQIFCELSVLGDVTGHSSTIQVPESRLLDDFGMIFESKKFSDFTLIADGREFKVHKTILAARSPVFAAMFEHEMEERKQNRVNIVDVNYEILHELLKFIYTGKVENLETMAGEILAAAEKYALDRLKRLCEKELCANLSTGNAAEILILADLHNANQLKVQAIDFINNNSGVKSTTGWREMIQTYPRLIADIYHPLEPQPKCEE